MEKKDLIYNKKTVWEDSKKDYTKKIFEFSEGYKEFLDYAEAGERTMA